MRKITTIAELRRLSCTEYLLCETGALDLNLLRLLVHVRRLFNLLSGLIDAFHWTAQRLDPSFSRGDALRSPGHPLRRGGGHASRAQSDQTEEDDQDTGSKGHRRWGNCEETDLGLRRRFSRMATTIGRRTRG